MLARLAQKVFLRAGHALHDWVDGLEMGRVGGEGDLDVTVAEHLVVLALGAEVVLDVAGAAELAFLVLAVELTEDVGQRLAHDVEQDVEATTVRHADDDLVEVLACGGVDDGVHERDERLGALQREALLAHVLGLQEALEGLCRVDLLQDVLLLSVGGLRDASLEAVAQPFALVAVHDVGVLGANLESVGSAQAGEHLAQRHLLLAAEAADVKGAVQIPDAQAMGAHVKVAVIRPRQARLAPIKRVDVCDEVTAGAVSLDELHDAGVLVYAGVRHVLCPAERSVGHAHGLEDFIPEGVIIDELADGAQELAGLRTLDDTVVVGGGQSDEAAHAQVSEAVCRGASELGRVIHRTDTDNRARTLGEAGDGVAGTNAARVGEVDGHAREVIHGQLVLAGTRDDVLVGVEELGKGLVLAVLDGGNDEGAGAVLLRKVDG